MHQSRGSFISMAPCGMHGTNWKFNKVKGTVESKDFAGTCVGYYNSAAPLIKLQQMVAPVPCDGSRKNWSTLSRTAVLRWTGGYSEATASEKLPYSMQIEGTQGEGAHVLPRNYFAARV